MEERRHNDDVAGIRTVLAAVLILRRSTVTRRGGCDAWIRVNYLLSQAPCVYLPLQ